MFPATRSRTSTIKTMKALSVLIPADRG